jgi:hypothetical protein
MRLLKRLIAELSQGLGRKGDLVAVGFALVDRPKHHPPVILSTVRFGEEKADIAIGLEDTLKLVEFIEACAGAACWLCDQIVKIT